MNQGMNREINREIMDLLETILIYKFPSRSRKQIEAMFELTDIRKTRVFQEALEEGECKGERKGERRGEREGKLGTVPLLLELGMSEEGIARELGLEVEAVREAAAKAPPRDAEGNGSRREPA